MIRRNVVGVVVLSALTVVGISLCTLFRCVYLPPPVAALFLIPPSFYACLILLNKLLGLCPENPHKYRLIGYVFLTIFYIALLPMAFWFGGGLGGFLTKTLDITNSFSKFIIFYSVILFAMFLMGALGSGLGWIVIRCVATIKKRDQHR